ncbi:MAG TPA: acyl-CoA thioester hydrolase/BAAT C-terminal domain-containing protein [Gaiellaceae bacterium]|nr:acyl-CoA thioester hydrolase/BAAT C-terminal domain-containing protein [Gaiellaceae bacterium]
MKLAAALLAALAATAAGGPSPYRYDRTLPFGVRVLAVGHPGGGVLVREVSYRVDARTREKAFLFTPAGAGPHPAIVFDPGRWQTRAFFYREALADARRGVEAISLDDLSTAYPKFTLADRATLIRRVVTVRRGLDLLASRPGVDTARLGLVGHSDGAEMGGIVAGLDHRLRAVVLMSGGGVWDRNGSAAYDRAVIPLNADNYVGRATAALFFQNALHDQYVPRADALDYQRHASAPKRVRWYDADHMLNARAERDRQAWLARRLGF